MTPSPWSFSWEPLFLALAVAAAIAYARAARTYHPSRTRASVFVLGLVLYGGIFVLPQFLQNVQHHTAEQSGLLLMPGGLGSTMKVLIVGKAVGQPVLAGLSYRVRLT